MDRWGGFHFEIPNLLAELGWPDTPAHRAELTQVIRNEIERLVPGSVLIHRPGAGQAN